MTNTALMVGADVQDVVVQLASTVRSLPPNRVVELPVSVSSSVASLLPRSLRNVDTLFGLNLPLTEPPTLAHRGWLYARYREACFACDVNPAIGVAIHHKDQFHEFGQTMVVKSPVCLVGFGDHAVTLLRAIQDAEAQFDPDDFDSDGYSK